MTRRVTNKEEFRAARLDLELSGEALANILCTTPRTVRRMEESGDYKPGVRPGGFLLACRILEWMLNTGFRPPEFKGRNSKRGRPIASKVTTT